MLRTNCFIGVPALALLLALAAVAPAGVTGQVRGEVPLFLAIPETFPEVDGRVVLLREPGRDVVLLRDSDATSETLSVALGLLNRLNARTPRRERLGQMVPITGYKLTTPINGARLAELDVVLTGLKARPVASLGNLGFGRSMRFEERDR
jgi:hypothetical protein